MAGSCTAVYSVKCNGGAQMTHNAPYYKMQTYIPICIIIMLVIMARSDQCSAVQGSAFGLHSHGVLCRIANNDMDMESHTVGVLTVSQLTGCLNSVVGDSN